MKKIYIHAAPLCAACLLGIAMFNIFHIAKVNPQGPLETIIGPKGLLLSDEKRVIDTLYQKTNGKNFAVQIKTTTDDLTWKYLFIYYGQQRYGLLPEFSDGQQNKDISSFTIIEPGAKKDFNTSREDHIGSFTLQEREY